MENRFTYDALAGPQDILSFWCQELTPADWYATSDALDDTIRARFLATWQAAADRRGGDAQFDSWRSRPDHLLAYLVLVDQFPRNMFRGDARSFATDAVALAAAKAAIGRGWDIRD